MLVPYAKSGSIKKLATELSSRLGYKVFRVSKERIRNRLGFLWPIPKNKLEQLTLLSNANVPTVEYTSDVTVARQWIADGDIVLCRTLLSSHSGKGIVVAEEESQLVPCRLYTKYFKKKKEFRVHILNGSVIDVQEKRKKRLDGLAHDPRIRNHLTGYIYARDNVAEPEGLRGLAVSAAAAIGYTSGGVDIAYNQHYNQMKVLEMNTTPGMEGRTLQIWADAIINWKDSHAMRSL